MKNQFVIPTKLGSIQMLFTKPDAAFVSTRFQYPDGKEERREITIRGKKWNGHLHFRLIDGIWEAMADNRSNGLVPIREDDGYLVVVGVHLTDKWDGIKFVSASHSAKLVFFREVREAVNRFCHEHAAEISTAQRKLEIEMTTAQYEAAVAKVEDLRKQLFEADNLVARLREQMVKEQIPLP